MKKQRVLEKVLLLNVGCLLTWVKSSSYCKMQNNNTKSDVYTLGSEIIWNYPSENFFFTLLF